MKIIIILLGGALAGIGLCGWQLYSREYRRRLDDSRRIARLEADKGLLIEGGQKDAEAILWYSEELAKSTMNSKRLQDRLSSVLCHRHNHIWKDGVCTKCGRIQE